jgi:hypothetical protein
VIKSPEHVKQLSDVVIHVAQFSSHCGQSASPVLK